MCLAGVFLLYYVGKLAASSSTVRASRLLHASVLYLPVVLVIMVIAKK
jgi:heme O synthase-like polyprenyltransferase